MERLKVTQLSCSMSNSQALQCNAVHHLLLQQNFHNKVNDLSNSMYKGGGDLIVCVCQSSIYVLNIVYRGQLTVNLRWRLTSCEIQYLEFALQNCTCKKQKNKKQKVRRKQPPRRVRKLRDIQRRLGQAPGPMRWRLERTSQMEPRKASGKVAATEPSSAS